MCLFFERQVSFFETLRLYQNNKELYYQQQIGFGTKSLELVLQAYISLLVPRLFYIRRDTALKEEVFLFVANFMKF